jgi:hypothetical protein
MEKSSIFFVESASFLVQKNVSPPQKMVCHHKKNKKKLFSSVMLTG